MNLKPVTFINATYTRYKQNTAQQLLLLKALKVTQDPERLRQMIGVKKVADVFRTLDKMTLRKEFHKSLTKCGIDFNYIVSGLKKEVESAESAKDRIAVYQTLLKSLGMDRYEDVGEGGAQWEDAFLKSMEKNKEVSPANGNKLIGESKPTDDYVVVEPEAPEGVRKKMEEENEAAKSLYS